ncbi:MAG: aminotransferase class IV [Chloroflexota bacterium]
MSELVYLNGEILPYEQATVHIDDRGFTLADGIYDVIRVYNGRPFEIHRHIRRIRRSAESMRIELDTSPEQIADIARDLIARQGFQDAQIYVQITRGVAPRGHAFPKGVKPTVLVAVRPPINPSPERVDRGEAAITVPDDRWGRCDVKTIGLTANVLARQRAVDAGVYEAIFVRDGYVTDCASCNAFAVFGQTVITAPKSNYILGGITREVVLEIARGNGLEALEESFSVDRFRRADEIFLTGTNTGIMPIITLDGMSVGSGVPGPVTRRLVELFRAKTAAN